LVVQLHTFDALGVGTESLAIMCPCCASSATRIWAAVGGDGYLINTALEGVDDVEVYAHVVADMEQEDAGRLGALLHG
jgi:hypothetical protein